MKISATDIKNSFGKYLQYALDGQTIIIMKNGKAVAKLESIESNLLKEEESLYMTNQEMGYKDFLALSKESDFRYEYIDGKVYRLPSPSFNHQVLSMKLISSLYQYFRNHTCQVVAAPLDIRLKNNKKSKVIHIVQPDVMVICDGDKLEDGKYMGTPTLVIEILSPSTRSKDMLKKLNLYKDTGIKEYWIVDPDQEAVLIYHFDNKELINFSTFKKERLKSFYFTDLTVDLSAIF